MKAGVEEERAAGYREIALTFADRQDWVLGRLLEHRARQDADRPYLQWEEGAALSFAQVNCEVNRLAHGFARAGVTRGERVMILLPNCLDYVLVWFALAKLGALEVPVNTHYRGAFLEHVANNCAARIVVTETAFLERLRHSEARMERLETVYVRDFDVAEPAFARVAMRPLEAVRSEDESDPGIEVRYTDPVAILFTSGTTGPAKGVVMPHAQMYFFAEQCASLVRLSADDVYLNAFPLFHGNAQFLTTYPCLIRGARAVLYERFSASDWIGRARRNGVTVTNLLGVTMDFVCKQPPQPDDCDNRLRLIYAVPTAGAILPEFKARFGVKVFVDAFGQTETCWPLMTPFDEARPAGAVGRVVDEWFDVRLVDPVTDEEVPVGALGELVVRHREPWTLCAGYNANPTGTAHAMRNLWWHTGDGMRRDDAGWFYFVDRVNDAMRVRGENVSSYEVEQVVLACDDVLECAAIGVPSNIRGGEHDIKVFVVARPGRDVDPAALIRHCEARAPHFAVPRYVEKVDALPRTPSEKLQKHVLRGMPATPATWDRLAAGVALAHELRRGHAS